MLGYIELAPFFKAASHALKPGGRLALVVHRENSPRREFEIFSELVAREPLVLTKRVAFDFPRDGTHLREELEQAGLEVIDGWEGSAVFRYRSAREVLDHLLESGAGTVFYDAIDGKVRDRLTGEFLSILDRQNGRRKTFEVQATTTWPASPGKQDPDRNRKWPATGESGLLQGLAVFQDDPLDDVGDILAVVHGGSRSGR